jgi:hypothetical protein
MPCSQALGKVHRHRTRVVGNENVSFLRREFEYLRIATAFETCLNGAHELQRWLSISGACNDRLV